ncbi:O-antigen ligase family protein [Prosthecobacter sp.]|uniref:O-antigen ligase family protein n=1 Tax=Prosthecobacter sp. TaxID=1965333 RepID=UPI001D534A1E|nr:O-antigen ligase family protein [Prosthecobacter sp.]MCB1279342.1 O-antigen ligase family protein [Prosthecobacter sp.]
MKLTPDPSFGASEKPPLLAGDTDYDGTMLHPPLDESQNPEDSEDDGSRASGSSYELPGPAWQGYVFSSLPILICLFGAGREAWSKGVAAVILGAAILLFPPQRKLPSLIIWSFLAAVLAPLLSFLPAQWIHLPEWRTHLSQDWGVALSDTVTPQASVTLEAWMLFALCATWLFWCLCRGFSNEQRRAMLYSLSTGGVILSLLSLIDSFSALKISWWPRSQEWGAGFGPFANRNHISSMAAIACVLCAACAYDAHRRKSRSWILFTCGFFIPAICIFSNTSRAGVALLFLGITAWLGASAMGRGFFKKMVVTTSLVLIISTLLVISSGGVGSRLSEQGAGKMVSLEGRGDIYLKTLEMISQTPWLGCGLGNFDAIFPQFAGVYNLRERPIHPESDLLWLLTEGGLLTVLPCLLACIWIFRATGPWFKSTKRRRSGRDDKRLRNSAAIAFFLTVIHGLFDVPLHGLGYFSMAALLAGIALRPRRLPLPAGNALPIITRLTGIAFIALGIAWLSISQGGLALPGSSTASFLRGRANQLTDSGSYADALPLFDEAIRQAPMDYRLYHERAKVRLYLQQPVNEALADFSRSRALEPNDTETCFKEGVVWLNYRPEYAIVPWREIMLRWPGYYYSTLLNYAESHPELKEPLWSLASTIDLKLQVLGRAQTREDFERALRNILVSPSSLDNVEPAQRESIFNLWYQHGDQAALISTLETNKKWRADGWRILAEHYARNSEFERACQTAIPYLPSIVRTAPGTSTDIPTLERALLYNPTDVRRVIDLFQAQKTSGDIDGALRTLEKIATMPNAPAYVRQEIAALYMAKRDFRRAWEYLREAMQKR